MALKVKAVERLVKFSKEDAGTYRYVMTPELYIALNQAKVIREAALRSGVSQGVMKACWDAAGEVIKAWATEGHSVALPGLGTMRFGLRAKSVEKVEDVKAGLISSRRIVFTPTQDLKDELASTAIQITCYDRNGDVVKRVTSADAGTVEDPESIDAAQLGPIRDFLRTQSLRPETDTTAYLYRVDSRGDVVRFIFCVRVKVSESKEENA